MFSRKTACVSAMVGVTLPLFAQPAGTAVKETPPQTTRTVAEDKAILENGRLRAQQNALQRLSKNRSPEAGKVLRAQWERLRAGDLPPPLWLDLLEATRKRNDPDLRTLLSEWDRSAAKSTDPLAAFRECLEGGNADEGRIVFTEKPEAGCLRCHSIEQKGGKIGPDLTWLRNSADRIRILESLILPNSTIAVGFENVLLKLKNDEQVAGIVSHESTDELTLTSVADGTTRQIKTADITERTPLPSAMPPIFGTVLQKTEIRDLIEFLAAGD